MLAAELEVEVPVRLHCEGSESELRDSVLVAQGDPGQGIVVLLHIVLQVVTVADRPGYALA
jgi:hypothetical protein